MRIHGTSIEFVRDLQSLGYSRVPAQELVTMRIHGVSPEYIRELQTLGYKRVSVPTLVNMRIHGVTIDFVRRIKERDPGVCRRARQYADSRALAETDQEGIPG